MKYYLMFDLGTGNSRVSLVDSNGEILGLKSFDNKYYRDDRYEDAQYIVPQEWEDKLISACTELCAEHPDIRVDAISSAAARQTFMLIDKAGKVFLGLPNIDNRGKEYVGAVSNKETIYKMSGKWVTEDFGAGKLLGLKMKDFEQYSRISKITSLSEWIGYILTGEACMEYSQASETQLYDLQKRKWSTRICDWYGIDIDILPELVESGSRLGHIKDEFKDKFNLAEGAAFIVGGADTQIGIMQTDIKEGDIAIVSGTTSPVVTLKKDFFYDREERVWTDANLGGHNYQIEMNPGVTGLNYQKMKNQFFPDVDYDEIEKYYSEMTEVRCTASFSSLLFYRKQSLRCGGFFMRSPLQDNVNRFDLMYAVLADIACATYEQLRRLIDISGNDPNHILGCGGGFQSETLCRMIASLSGKPVVLKNGFRQATIQGLVAICNRTFEISAEQEAGYTTYEPDPANLVFTYYPVWSENRLRANSIV